MFRAVVAFSLGLLMAMVLTACSDSSSGNAGPATGTGKLIDAPVVGVSYISGSHSGVTGADGSFIYEQGKTVKFFIGNVVLGETAPNGTVTLIDLVPNATGVTDPAVTKIAQLLQTLDTGATPGVITIPGFALAANVPAVNLSTTPAADLSTLLNSMGCTTPLVSELTAQNNFKSNVFNLYAGVYSGIYSGASSGTWILTVDSNGQMSGSADNGAVSLTGSVSLTGTSSFSGGGSISGGDTFSGVINPATGTFSGTWGSNSTVKGPFSGSKAAPSIAVMISPQSSTISAGGTQQFSSTVTGDTSTAVNWSVTETNGGTVSGSGLYTAPSAAGTYHVVATSVANPAKYATATVTVLGSQAQVSISISPDNTSLVTGATQQYSSKFVNNGTGSAGYVIWSVQEGDAGGTITNGGLYTAPSTVGIYHVVAISSSDSTIHSSATVTVVAAPVFNISGTISAGGAGLSGVTVTLTGSGSTSTTTDTNGTYSFAGARNGVYTITPGKTGYSFSPASISATVSNTNLSEQNFAAGGISTQIGGTVQGTAIPTPTSTVTFTTSLVGPKSMASDGTYLYVMDYNIIKKIAIATGTVTTIAGNSAVNVYNDGIGSAANFYAPQGLTKAGSNLYVTDRYRVRKINLDTNEVTTFAGSSVAASWDGIGTAARFSNPCDITTDGTSLFVNDSGSMRKIEISTATVSTFSSVFLPAYGMTTDGINLYIQNNLTISKISLASGIATTIVGASNVRGTTDGIGTSARLNSTGFGITTDGINVYFMDGTKLRKMVIETTEVSTTTLTNGGWQFLSTDGKNLFIATPTYGSASIVKAQ